MVMPAPAAGVSAVPAQGVQIYVSGAVGKPGLYEVPAGSRAPAAIAAAGGMTLEANADKVNLAKLLKDGMQVNVPRLNAKQLREQRSVAVADRSAATAGCNDVAVGKSSAARWCVNSQNYGEGQPEYGVGSRTDLFAGSGRCNGAADRGISGFTQICQHRGDHAGQRYR